MSIGSFVRRVVPTVTSFVTSGGNPAIALATAVETDKQLKRAKQAKMQAEQQRQQEKQFMEIFTSSGNLSRVQTPMNMGSTANAGFGSSFGNFLSDVGQNIVNPFANLFNTLSPFFGGRSISQPAITTPTIDQPRETSTSGTTDAFLSPSIINPVITGAKNLLKSPLGNIAIGTGAGSLLGGLTPTASGKPRITRKMKSQARMIVNLTGGNLQAAADILNMDVNTLIFILLKRFRNDGPVVTKAALRKTKSTIRRLHNMQDVLKSITPTSTGRKRAPVRRSMSTTLIKN